MTTEIKRFNSIIKSKGIDSNNRFKLMKRFVGRYNFILSLEGMYVRGDASITDKTVDNYFELNKLFLLVTTIEVMHRATRTFNPTIVFAKSIDDKSKIKLIPPIKLLNKIRTNKNLRKYFDDNKSDFIFDNDGKITYISKKIDRFYKSEIDDINGIVIVLRNLFSHGTLTTTPFQLKKDREMLSELNKYLIDQIEVWFGIINYELEN